MNLFTIAYVKYWFLYKSFNTKSLFKKEEWTWTLSFRSKSMSSTSFLYDFAQGHLRFHVLMFLQKLSSTREPNRRVSEGFVKSIYRVWQRDLQGHCPHLCASRLFALVLEDIIIMYGGVQFSRWPLWHTIGATNCLEPLQVWI